MRADLGADVVKVERPGIGDDTRAWHPPADHDGTSTYFLSVNRNKRSVVLDLTTEAGLEQARALVAESDVLVENFRPGTMERPECVPTGGGRTPGPASGGALQPAPLDIHPLDAAGCRDEILGRALRTASSSPRTQVALRGRTRAALEARTLRLVPAEAAGQRSLGEPGFEPDFAQAFAKSPAGFLNARRWRCHVAAMMLFELSG
jgi:hypothetical protein